MNIQKEKVALVTGGGRRIGAAIVRLLHDQGWRVLIHCRNSRLHADALATELNAARANSAVVLVADLLDSATPAALASQAQSCWGRLDLLVNNASSFYPTAVGSIGESDWQDLMGSNLKAPLFLVQACQPLLSASQGNIVNLVDVHALRPLGGHALYESAKAGLIMLTKALARDLAPAVRVNAVAPGNILWSDDHPHDPVLKARLLERVPLARMGSAEEVAATVGFLASDGAAYVTGQVIAVDGGYSLT